ncbi:putative isoaspartyl peptidase/L-asparaginase 2 [Heracleum sosnowskyi]|uniref:Isoaspartyl peptidase/L-asparaginase 2 n=1 Tax=Heracleum sosnowskyi TaxID=360622 RepID=A0AAD8GXN9_9APIA|nr:putative isoaspartyl peptidase/L-asparaginase 2 [Heracleum sosnowskyi]
MKNEELHIVIILVQVRELETNPFFNSGRGSALTEKGIVEMEASIMDGKGRQRGAVSNVTTVKNPISLARLVKDKSPHSYLAFSGAEAFAKKASAKLVRGNASHGISDASAVSSREARILAEDAFFHPSMMSVS